MSQYRVYIAESASDGPDREIVAEVVVECADRETADALLRRLLDRKYLVEDVQPELSL